jgi:hypothetical protein
MKILQNALVTGISIAVLSSVFYGCGNGNESHEATNADTLDMEADRLVKTTGKLKNILYAIPSPIELSQIIQRAGAKYNKDILNSPSHISKYNTTVSKALNLGVYGADLSYTGVFDGTIQESITYLNCTRKLAEELGVGSAFNESTVTRMQKNTGVKDSLLNIISDSYMNTDALLKESQRESSSSLVIAGGFVEALYIGTQLSKSSSNPEDIISRVAEQKGTLDNVVSMLSAFENDANITPVLHDLKSLKELFNEVKVDGKSNPDVKTNPNTKITTIGGKISYSISPESVEKLTAKALEIRSKIVDGKI